MKTESDAHEAGSEQEEIEWIERGWPLREDGTCDTSLASEQGLVAMSRGLTALDRTLRDAIFTHRGGAWNKFGPGPFDELQWPMEFPCSIVLRAEPRLRPRLGCILVLALLEWRWDPSGRRFMRCLWFILPASWGEELLQRRVRAASELLLRHRGRPARPAETPPLRLQREDLDAHTPPSLDRVSARLLTARAAASPSELLMGLVARAAHDGYDPSLLTRGLAAPCSPEAGDEVDLGVIADPDLLRAVWRHPVPIVHHRVIPVPSPSALRSAESKPPQSTTTVLHQSPSCEPQAAAFAVAEPRALSPRRSRANAATLGVVLGLQALQLTLLGVLVARGRESGVDRPGPSPGTAALPAEETTVPAIQVPDRLWPTITDGILAVSISSMMTAAGAEAPSPGELDVLAWLAAGEPLAVVGFSASEDCEGADQMARDHVRSVTRWLGASPEIETIIVGARAAVPPPLAPHTAMLADALVLRSSAANRWRVLAAADCAEGETRPVGDRQSVPVPGRRAASKLHGKSSPAVDPRTNPNKEHPAKTQFDTH